MKMRDHSHLAGTAGLPNGSRVRRTIFVLGIGLIMLGARALAADPISVVQLVRDSRGAMESNQLEQAAALAHAAVTADPAFADGWKQLGIVQSRQGQAAAAIESLQTALKLKPDDYPAWLDLGWALWGQNRRDEALAALDQAIRGGVKNADDAALQVVARLAEEGQGARAIELYRGWRPDRSLLAAALELIRKGRVQAAEPLLEQAWQTGADRTQAGLYLAYARAVNGRCGGSADYLQPAMSAGIDRLEPAQQDWLLDVIKTCSETRQMTPILAQAAAALADKPEYAGRIADILEKAADEQRIRQDPAVALDLYRRLLALVPDRPTWVHAVNLESAYHGQAAAIAMLTNLQARAATEAVRAGVAGRLAEERGDQPGAIARYQASIADQPDQPLIRQALFRLYVQSGALDQARAEADWFAQRVDAGDSTLRSYLAEMRTALNEPQSALDLWQILNLSAPHVPYYGVEAANALLALCRPDEARALLEPMAAATPHPLLFEALAELETALGQPARAAEWAQQGLAHKPTQGLRRYLAESQEAAGLVSTATVAAALEFVRHDPGYVPMQLLAGRALYQLGQTNAAVAHYQGLLARNPALEAGLIFLKDAASLQGQFGQAVDYMETADAWQPWDYEIARKYAIALAENESYTRAFRILRRIGRHNPNELTAVLIYTAVSDCPLPGRNTADQVADHISSLAASNYLFATPADLTAPPTNRPRVLLVIADTAWPALERIDAALARHGARAVYAGDARSLAINVPGRPSPAQLEQLVRSGRWVLATTGPTGLRRQTVAADGRLGNPLTHALYADGKPETPAAYSNRLDALLAESAAPLAANAPRLLVYPFGDYGQSSLDVTPENLAALRAAVARHFDFAIYYDEAGFVPTDFSAAHLPGKVVPGHWTTNELVLHLRQGNPVTRARLDLAKLLYWQSQHAAANVWFRRAAAAGADPYAVSFNWGGNAFQEGANATALKQLRRAVELSPNSGKAREALARAEDRRRPELNLRLSGWDDNEDRSYRQWGGHADVFVHDRLRLGALVDRNRWRKSGLGEEEGTRWGGRLLAYIWDDIWFDGQLWQLNMDNLDNHVGGAALLHLPNPLLSGHLEFYYGREEIETVEALRKEIYANMYALRTYTRIYDDFDLFANLNEIQRTDDNDTQMLEGRLLYRIKEWPYLGAGYRFRVADSDEDPPEYWAPENFQQHQATASLRGNTGWLNYQMTGDAGYSKELGTDWKFVWGGRARAELNLIGHERLSLYGEAVYFEGAVYRRTTWTAGLTGKF